MPSEWESICKTFQDSWQTWTQSKSSRMGGEGESKSCEEPESLDGERDLFFLSFSATDSKSSRAWLSARMLSSSSLHVTLRNVFFGLRI